MVAAAAGGVLLAENAAAQPAATQPADVLPRRGTEGADVLGPTNPPRDAQDRNMLVPPRTDHGTLPNLKWSFADSHVRIQPGGWARETTVRELPVSTDLSGVNMRLEPGAVREMHWHKQSEWSYVLAGNARITAVDVDGRTFQDDVAEGDLWYFPAGIPHSIQGTGERGCEFLLVFDDGSFSEDSTFLITDWLAHTPRKVLAKNFGWPESAFDRVPKEELYIFRTDLPPPLAADRVAGAGPVPRSFSHRMTAQEPLRTRGGAVRVADSGNFPASQAIAGVLVDLEPGAMRELHWHPDSNEWQFYIAGEARMTVFGSSGKARTFDYRGGDVGYVPVSMGHYIENTGTTPVRYLEMFTGPRYSDMSLAQWMALTPHALVEAHLGIDRALLDGLRTEKTPVVPG